MNPLFAPVQLLIRGINRSRRALYRMKILRRDSLPRPVISIGNIAMGGAGKTPSVITVARWLASQNLRVVVLTRGYGRRGRDRWAEVDALDASRFGDEPVLMRRRLPDSVTIIVGSRRFNAATAWLRDNDCDVFILDDGFQHLQLARDLDLVIDNRRARWYRESRAALRWADGVLVRGRGTIERLPDGPPVFRATLEPEAVAVSGGRRSTASLTGLRIVAFSGLADNVQFADALRHLGATIVRFDGFDDHHRYSDEELDAIVRSAAALSASLILTTEKDWVKIGPWQDQIGYLEVSMLIRPERQFHDLLMRVLSQREKDDGQKT